MQIEMVIKCKECSHEAVSKTHLARHPKAVIPQAHGHGKRANAHLVPMETKERVYQFLCVDCGRRFLNDKGLKAHSGQKHRKLF